MKEDWIEIELGELLRLKNGFAFKAKDYIADGIPVFRIGDINDWVVSDKNAKRIEEKLLYDDYIVENGDILIAMSGATTGKFGIYNSENKAYQNQRVGNLKLHSDEYINKSFVFYLLYSLKRKIEEDAYGGAQPNISATKIEALKTKLAPLPIQRAIVSKIETLFSDLDNGIANLQKAQEQLKIYRQAVLKKAFEGELTKEWRKDKARLVSEGKAKPLPTAEELLKQIKEERQNHYNEQIEDWKKAVKEWEKNGKEGKKPTKPRAIKELPPLTEDELKELQVLPESWDWVAFSNIGFWTGGGTPSKSKSDYWENGNILWITSKDMKSKVMFDSIDKITADAVKFSSAKMIAAGSVLFVMRSGILRRVLPVAITNYLATVNQDLQALTPYLVKPEFIYWFSVSNEYDIRKNCAKDGTTVESVESTSLKQYPFSLCSLEEQTQIIQEIESRLSVCDKMEQSITESLKKANALRQSILKKAFEGKLLSESEIEACKQAEDYEPASVLLEKIKAEKLAKEKEAKKTKKKSKK